ncbi:tape measure protein [Parasporobacterium paucivorans]|uniref:Tape measure domain-containing protein n=1 Tax=Parasporobacterium paucivorans DSM 15970 TaxID=1122934 RepID=A0A1M6B1C9_9FIRM|nr:tape measure protein [Parasporobacterium paucivorans]SHI42521.1 tape measure domain-containing protein [Parasporobacterium paucivorans DSM 15970]
MASDGTIKIGTELDDSGLKKGLNDTGGKAAGLASAGLTAAAAAVAAVAAAMGAGAVIGVKYNSQIETYETSFAVMTGSAEKATEVIDKLKELGASTPFELTDLADTTQLLMNYGFTADGAIEQMMMLGDISQGSSEKMTRIATAYGQMSSAGKVSLEDIKQMIESGYNPLMEISQSTGESMASLYDRISEGTISVDEITASMERSTAAGGKYFGSMAAQSETFAGKLSTLKDNALQLVGSLTEGIQAGLTGSILPAAIDAVAKLTEAFKTGGAEGLIEAGSTMLTDVLTGITENIPMVIDMAMLVINTILQGLTENIPQLITAGFGMLRALVTGIAQMAPQLFAMALSLILEFCNQLSSNIPWMIQTGMGVLMGLANGIMNALPQLVEQIPTIIISIVNAIVDNLPLIIGMGIDIIVMLIQGLSEAIPQLIAAIPDIVIAIVDALAQTDWAKIGGDILTGIKDGFVAAAKGLGKSFTEALGGAVDIVKDFLGIHSPSTLMRDLIGKNLMLGIGVGVEDNAPDLGGKIRGSMGKLVNGIQSDVGSVGAVYGIGTTMAATSSSSNSMDYNKLGTVMANAISGMGIKVDGREFGRVIADVARG